MPPIRVSRKRFRNGNGLGLTLSQSYELRVTLLSLRSGEQFQEIMSLDDMVEKTSTLISSVIQKPKMTPKLLAKPPFRFLHDIFIGVTKATGLGEGLFEGDLLDSSKFQDNKEAKMLFLKRWIDFVSVSAGELLQADPRKIISGLDVENTNLMLQAFALLAVRVRDGLVSNA
ncbi:hypothetical protein BVRB_020330, partial [Beta vulgaris subsp. vulgaris]